MDISILQEDINQAVNKCLSIITSKVQLPILNYFLLETKDKKQLEITSTDLITGIKIELPAKVREPGKIAVNAKTFAEIINSLPKKEIHCRSQANKLQLEWPGSKAEISTAAADDYPVLKQLDKPKQHYKINLPSFVKTLSRTIIACSNDDTRPVLTGLLIKEQEGEIFFVGTDGFRLSLDKISAKELKKDHAYRQAGKERGEKFELIVSARGLQQVLRNIGIDDKDNEDKADKKAGAGKELEILFLEQNKLGFDLGQIKIVASLLEGEFPPFSQIIPKEKETTVVVDREELLSRLKTAAVFARDAANIVRLEISAGEIKLSANAAQVGSNVARISAQVKGKKNKIAFNYRYLLDFLNSVDAPEVIFEMSQSLSPGVFRLPGDPNYLHLIMPVRVQN